MEPKNFAMNRRNLSHFYLQQYSPNYNIADLERSAASQDETLTHLRETANNPLRRAAEKITSIFLRKAS